MLKGLAAIVAGIVAGLALTWASVNAFGFGSAQDGPWRTSTLVGSSSGGPALRAYIALHGLFAMNRSEAVYYTARRDSEGHRLTGDCRYSLAGRDPAARWWSITAYGPDDFLIPNAARRYAVSKTSVARQEDGIFTVAVASTGGGADWIPVGPGRFSLTLRLYNPAPAVTADPAHVVLPAIRRVACR